MHCAFCRVVGIQNQQSKTQVRNALLKLPGVMTVEIDVDQGTARVRYNQPATNYDIMRCIEDTGFSVERL